MPHTSNIMYVIKRDGRHERVSFDKITYRIEQLCNQLSLDRIDPIKIAQETINGLSNGITTEELDIFASVKCAEKMIIDPQYNILAAGLCISNLHKKTNPDFMLVTEKLYELKKVSEEYFNFVKSNIDVIQKSIRYNRDFDIDFFGIKTLEKSYLLNYLDNSRLVILERPQHLYMRVSLGIHMIDQDINGAIETYDLMSQKYMTHASPTLYNSGTNKPQLSSCFLLGMNDDLDDIYKTLGDCAQISKWAGGIGLQLSRIRAKGSMIRGTGGKSDGIVPLIKVINAQSRYINQGGRRNGAVACWIEPWHSDIYDFCELRKNVGSDDKRARDVFLGLWVPDLFMKRAINNEHWSLMCPDECPGLTDTFGDEFEELYKKYEEEKKYKKQVQAMDLLIKIIESQIETGMPYFCFKDHANRLSNQQNIGNIVISNLCVEIYEVCNQDETAVCNLGSICLPKFLDSNNNFDYEKLKYVSGVLTKNLNKIIDSNYYPTENSKKSNMKNRPMGIGIQGAADLFCLMNIPYDSQEAFKLTSVIHENIYYGALKASNELAMRDGPYETYEGSPASKQLLQYDLYGYDYNDLTCDWAALKDKIQQYGLRNSLFTACMPTASTSQIMGNNECTEPFSSNLYTRTTQAGEFIVINKHLIELLIKNNLWTREIRQEFMFDNGSIQNIDEIPPYIKDIYKTAFEMKIKPVVDHAIARAPFIDQGQSMNLFCKNPDFSRVMSSLVFAWKNKLKTGMYYLRSQPAVDAIKFGLDPEIAQNIAKKRGINNYNRVNQSQINNQECSMCSA